MPKTGADAACTPLEDSTAPLAPAALSTQKRIRFNRGAHRIGTNYSIVVWAGNDEGEGGRSPQFFIVTPM